MIFNPVIIGAIVVQSIISKSSKIAGAIAGYVITTGIMVWGLSLYRDGSQIAFFGIPLSKEVFVIACLIWYGFDTKSFNDAKKVTGQASSQSPPLTPEEGTLNSSIVSNCDIQKTNIPAKELYENAYVLYDSKRYDEMVRICDVLLSNYPSSKEAQWAKKNFKLDKYRTAERAIHTSNVDDDWLTSFKNKKSVNNNGDNAKKINKRVEWRQDIACDVCGSEIESEEGSCPKCVQNTHNPLIAITPKPDREGKERPLWKNHRVLLLCSLVVVLIAGFLFSAIHLKLINVSFMGKRTQQPVQEITPQLPVTPTAAPSVPIAPALPPPPAPKPVIAREKSPPPKTPSTNVSESIRLYLKLGYALHEEGSYDKAMEMFNRVLKNEHGNVEALTGIKRAAEAKASEERLKAR